MNDKDTLLQEITKYKDKITQLQEQIANLESLLNTTEAELKYRSNLHKLKSNDIFTVLHLDRFESCIDDTMNSMINPTIIYRPTTPTQESLTEFYDKRYDNASKILNDFDEFVNKNELDITADTIIHTGYSRSNYGSGYSTNYFTDGHYIIGCRYEHNRYSGDKCYFSYDFMPLYDYVEMYKKYHENVNLRF